SHMRDRSESSGLRLADFEANRHVATFLKTFCVSHTGFDGQYVTPILRKQRGGPPCATDLRTRRDHSPAIRHESRDGTQIVALLRGYAHKIPRRRTFPEPDLAIEFKGQC